MLPFPGECFFFIILKDTLLSIHFITIERQICNLVPNGHNLGLHVALEIGDLGLLLLQHEVQQLLAIIELILRVAQRRIAHLDLHDLRVLVTVLVLDGLEELFILFHGCLLLLNAILLRL